VNLAVRSLRPFGSEAANSLSSTGYHQVAGGLALALLYERGTTNLALIYLHTRRLRQLFRVKHNRRRGTSNAPWNDP